MFGAVVLVLRPAVFPVFVFVPSLQMVKGKGQDQWRWLGVLKALTGLILIAVSYIGTRKEPNPTHCPLTSTCVL